MSERDVERGRIMLVYGPPGTGKTTYLSNELRRAVGLFPADSIYVVSLTNAAAKEIAGRDLGRLPPQNVGTLHSRCWRHIGLEQERFFFHKSGDWVREWNEQNWGLKISGKGMDIDDPLGEADQVESEQEEFEGDLFTAEYSRLRHLRLPRSEWQREAEATFWIANPAKALFYAVGLPAFVDRYETFKRERELFDFDDMIERALGHPALSGSVLVVDEAQDLSPLEVAVIRSWSAGFSSTVLAGDDDQALYSFRGGSPDTMLGLNPAAERVLSQSHRLKSRLLERAQLISGRILTRKAKTFAPIADGGMISEHPTCTHKWPEEFVDRAAERAKDGQSTMILAPCGYLLKGAIAALKERGIPFWNPYRCSPPGEPILTSDGWIPIEKLDPSYHRIAGFKANTNALSWGPHWKGDKSRPSGPLVNGERRGFAFSVERQPYDGQILTVRTDRSATQITPNHRVRVRFAEEFYRSWVVYLMRCGGWWRIGLSGPRRGGNGSRDLRNRLTCERGDSAWVLGVYSTLREARRAECVFQAKSGITGAIFREQGSRRYFTQVDLDAIHTALSDVSSDRASQLLREHGLLQEHPLYRRDGQRRRQHVIAAFETVAANLLPGFMLFPTIPEEFTDSSCQRSAPVWRPFTVERSHYRGEVYSLDVPGPEHYVSGWAVVHNSKKGAWNPIKANCSRLAAFLRPDPKYFGDHAQPWSLVDIAQWVEPLSRKQLGLSEKQVQAIKDAARIAREEDPKAAYAPLPDESLPRLGFSQRVPRDLESYVEMMLPSQRAMFIYGISIAQKNPRMIGALEHPNVIVGTVHSTKGGEADHVCLLPETSPRGAREMATRGADSTLRMLYVACTRARESLSIGGSERIGNDLSWLCR